MKYLFLILIIIFSASCASKVKTKKAITEQNPELKPPFSNQGEQEDYWTQEFFKNNYKKQKHNIFVDKIEILKEKELLDGHGNLLEFLNEIRFGNRTINIHLPDLKYQPIFKNGILYPEIISENDFEIGGFEELKFLSHPDKIKRFRIWVFHKNRANPEVYLFELTNKHATEETNLTDFLKNAELTFIKNGWIIL